jgi:hypothetical protein
MFCRARALVLAASLLLIPGAARAQMIWQPAPAPLVTADNTIWFTAGDPVEWNGDRYYPGGASQFFNAFQMVRAGSFKGIPLYTDTTLQPNSVVFVPLSGGRMQPYERTIPGTVAGTTGSRPPVVVAEIGPYSAPLDGRAQAAGPPAFAPAYDVVMLESNASVTPGPTAVGTSGRSVPAAATSGGSTAAPAPAAMTSPGARTVAAPPARTSTLRKPSGANGIWINFDGRRWFSGGKAIDYEAASLTQIGTYHGWSVYTRNGDASMIYVPSTPGRLTPYKAK